MYEHFIIVSDMQLKNTELYTEKKKKKTWCRIYFGLFHSKIAKKFHK